MYDIEASLCTTGCLPPVGTYQGSGVFSYPLDAPETLPTGGATNPETGVVLNRDGFYDPTWLYD